jgi:hypothetical protein
LRLHPEKHLHDFPVLVPYNKLISGWLYTSFSYLFFCRTERTQISFTLIDHATRRPETSSVF